MKESWEKNYLQTVRLGPHKFPCFHKQETNQPKNQISSCHFILILRTLFLHKQTAPHHCQMTGFHIKMTWNDGNFPNLPPTFLGDQHQVTSVLDLPIPYWKGNKPGGDRCWLWGWIQSMCDLGAETYLAFLPEHVCFRAPKKSLVACCC